MSMNRRDFFALLGVIPGMPRLLATPTPLPPTPTPVPVTRVYPGRVTYKVPHCFLIGMVAGDGVCSHKLLTEYPFILTGLQVDAAQLLHGAGVFRIRLNGHLFLEQLISRDMNQSLVLPLGCSPNDELLVQVEHRSPAASHVYMVLTGYIVLPSQSQAG